MASAASTSSKASTCCSDEQEGKRYGLQRLPEAVLDLLRLVHRQGPTTDSTTTTRKMIMNTDELQLLNTVVKGTLEWYNTNAPEGKSGDTATFSDFLMDLAIKFEQGGLGHDGKALLQEAVVAGFGE